VAPSTRLGRAARFHFRTDRPYGVPEHYGAYGPQNAITKLQATHMGTVDYQGAPQRYALTETATTDTSDLEPGDFDDGDWPFPEKGLGPSDSGEDSSLKAGPGEMMLLRGFKAVGQFDAAKPAVFLDPIMFNVRAMAQITDTPLRMFDPQSNQRSGVVLPGGGQPVHQQGGEPADLLRRRLHEAFVFALRRLGIEDPVVTVDWVPARSVSTAEGWQTVKAKIDAGVPRRQALMEAGYRAEQVDAWLAGTDDAELQRRVDVLASLADSAQKLGAAAALGVITSEQVTALLSGTIDDLEASPARRRKADAVLQRAPRPPRAGRPHRRGRRPGEPARRPPCSATDRAFEELIRRTLTAWTRAYGGPSQPALPGDVLRRILAAARAAVSRILDDVAGRAPGIGGRPRPGAGDGGAAGRRVRARRVRPPAPGPPVPRPAGSCGMRRAGSGTW
jgi:hypothetical protein